MCVFRLEGRLKRLSQTGLADQLQNVRDSESLAEWRSSRGVAPDDSPDMATRLLQLAPAPLLGLVGLSGHGVLGVGGVVIVVLAVHGVGLLGLEREVARGRAHRRVPVRVLIARRAHLDYLRVAGTGARSAAATARPSWPALSARSGCARPGPRCEVRVDLQPLPSEQLVLCLMLLVLLVVLGGRGRGVGRAVGHGAERAVGRREPKGLCRVRRLWRALRRGAAATAAPAATARAGGAGRRAVATVVALGQLVVRKAAQVERLDEGNVGHVCCVCQRGRRRARECPGEDGVSREKSGVEGGGRPKLLMCRGEMSEWIERESPSGIKRQEGKWGERHCKPYYEGGSGGQVEINSK